MVLTPEERRTLAVCSFVAACICFAPGDWVSGAATLAVSGALFLWHNKKLKAEAAAEKAARQGFRRAAWAKISPGALT